MDMTPEEIQSVYYAYQADDKPGTENYEDTDFNESDIPIIDDWEDVPIENLEE